jgi:hypothetical protein
MEQYLCRMRGSCGFMRQYHHKLRELTHFYRIIYCTGMKMCECKRMEYQELHGTPPSDEMMPNGMVVPEVVAKSPPNRRPRCADGAADLSSHPFPKSPIRVAS